MAEDPTTNGHDKAGRFTKGNGGGPGNPHVDRVGKLRAAMLAAVSEKAMKNVIKKLIELAESGDLKAIQLLFDRTLGKVSEAATTAVVAVDPVRTAADGTDRLLEIAERVRARRSPEMEADFQQLRDAAASQAG